MTCRRASMGSQDKTYPIIVREPDVAGAVFLRARCGSRPRAG